MSVKYPHFCLAAASLSPLDGVGSLISCTEITVSLGISNQAAPLRPELCSGNLEEVGCHSEHRNHVVWPSAH